ncbi:alpha-amylase family protein [Cytophagaceae bacterium YF14B1]|uniref:Alpha-amylase family protein n=1 Tax=Xanthocytophaga flava TaxID=3048013 RepID=A0AAE3U7N4_9BACT|nr:alpha-amylase family protein [Xanthocytophaga flavus]MDJ1481802.1 alpha-amylase family protein [Xanthocytophaga flavus]
MKKKLFLTAALVTGLLSCSPKKDVPMLDTNDENLLKEEVTDNKLTIYQVFTRLLTNTKHVNKKYGTLEENGVGKFNDINERLLGEVKKMGFSHIWYTGVIEHATMTDYTKYGIPLDDADVVKGRAGSPYAIKDYYDVSPDLAVDVPKRMQEFEALLARTHKVGLKVIIDFVPNHVARTYHSDAKPTGVQDLGEGDDKSKIFDTKNNFYYLPGTSFRVPHEYHALGDLPHPTKDGHFDETPAKATGNDQFTPGPHVNDWFETIKLNYGVDIVNNRARHFEPIPNTWEKMRDILLFWTKKGVDGFRCDMAEMVPAEFWGWVIPQIKEANKDIVFIAEIYNPYEYNNYIDKAKFDYLYDKVGLYDTLRSVIQHGTSANLISANWKNLQGINNHMLRFMENHDEQRIASQYFAGKPEKGIPAMVVSATLNSGPIMVYFGQEVGEPALGEEGFSGDDGRTTIFDYWGVPQFQNWMSVDRYDGVTLEPSQQLLREKYVKLLNFCATSEAIRKGGLYDLQAANNGGKTAGYEEHKIYSYLRFTENQKLLIIVSFEESLKRRINVRIPTNALAAMELSATANYDLKCVLGDHKPVSFNAANVTDPNNAQAGIPLELEPLTGYIFEIKEESK